MRRLRVQVIAWIDPLSGRDNTAGRIRRGLFDCIDDRWRSPAEVSPLDYLGLSSIIVGDLDGWLRERVGTLELFDNLLDITTCIADGHP